MRLLFEDGAYSGKYGNILVISWGRWIRFDEIWSLKFQLCFHLCYIHRSKVLEIHVQHRPEPIQRQKEFRSNYKKDHIINRMVT